jgi:hypothetical protein
MIADFMAWKCRNFARQSSQQYRSALDFPGTRLRCHLIEYSRSTFTTARSDAGKSMPYRIVAVLFAIAAALLGLADKMRSDGNDLTYVDAPVVSAVHYCVPHFVKYGKPNRYYYPRGLTKFGLPCSETATLQREYQKGYRELYDYWNAEVSVSLPDVEPAKRQITTYGKPLILFKKGSNPRDPDATRGLNLSAKDYRPVEPGDRLPVSIAFKDGLVVNYAPNHIEYDQYMWVLLGLAGLVAMIAALFAGDGMPFTAEDRKYRDQMLNPVRNN